MNFEEVKALDQKYHLNNYGERLPILPVKGEGCTIYDSEGRAYLDCFAGIAVSSLGYGHPALTKAIREQSERLIHTCNYFYNEPQAKLAQLLCDYTCADRAFFCNSGGEANEAAIKLARKYFYAKGEKRFRIVSAENSFHGRTLATVTATAQEKYQLPFAPLPEGFSYVPFNDIEALRAAITPETAAVILEPIQGEGGVIPSDWAYLQNVRALCDETGTLLIFDEVQTGVGRTGDLFAHQLYGVEPDIFTSAKALAGGVPIGALLAKEHVCAFTPGDHGTTFGGNPLACAAGVAVIETMLTPGFLANVRKVGAAAMEALRGIGRRFPDLVMDVRGAGLMLGMALDEALPVKTVQLAMLEKGFIIGTAGGNTLRIMPPLVIEEKALLSMIDALGEVLAAQNNGN